MQTAHYLLRNVDAHPSQPVSKTASPLDVQNWRRNLRDCMVLHKDLLERTTKKMKKTKKRRMKKLARLHGASQKPSGKDDDDEDETK
jgi:hypothetical protein